MDRILRLLHKSHGLRVFKTLHYLGERVWWPGVYKDIKRYIDECYVCSIAVSRNDPPPIKSMSLPSGPWEVVALEFKGPVGGNVSF